MVEKKKDKKKKSDLNILAHKIVKEATKDKSGKKPDLNKTAFNIVKEATKEPTKKNSKEF